MNKQELLQKNVLPEGKEAWLSYDNYLKLKHLFETVPLPSVANTLAEGQYLDLHHFLTDVAGLELPLDEVSIHFNAFNLLRRGYKIESISQEEYEQLLRLMVNLEEPDIDDLELYETGGHRVLYNYLTMQMGLSVQKGRGPTWYRAKALIKAYEVQNMTPTSAE
jgi:hypothetical protein